MSAESFDRVWKGEVEEFSWLTPGLVRSALEKFDPYRIGTTVSELVSQLGTGGGAMPKIERSLQTLEADGVVQYEARKWVLRWTGHIIPGTNKSPSQGTPKWTGR